MYTSYTVELRKSYQVLIETRPAFFSVWIYAREVNLKSFMSTAGCDVSMRRKEKILA